jgi:hypothetical protein
LSQTLGCNAIKVKHFEPVRCAIYALMVGNRFFKLTTFKMTFRDRTVVREIDVCAVYAVASHFESLVRKIDVLSECFLDDFEALVLQNHTKSIRLFEHSKNNLT